MELPKEINPQLGVFIFLFFIIYIVVFQNWIFFAIPIFSQHNTPTSLNSNNTSGNITIVYRDVIKLVTPTSDGHTYFASEYQNGTRLLQRPFSWMRYNVLGKQDMKVTTIVYDYKIFEKLHSFNPTDYKYDEILPTSEDKKFLMIFIYVFMDDVIGDDTRMWAFNRSFFAVYDGKTTYRAIEYQYDLRFRELENTFTFDRSTGVEGFKSSRRYSKSTEYFSTAGQYNDEIYYLRGGKSNAIDGFLLYEIDENKTPEDLLVLGQFYMFGSAQWRLRT
jgi:hypothetical protein